MGKRKKKFDQSPHTVMCYFSSELSALFIFSSWTDSEKAEGNGDV